MVNGYEWLVVINWLIELIVIWIIVINRQWLIPMINGSKLINVGVYTG